MQINGNYLPQKKSYMVNGQFILNSIELYSFFFFLYMQIKHRMILESFDFPSYNLRY